MAWGTPSSLGTNSVSAGHSFSITGVTVAANSLILIAGAMRAHATLDAIVVTDSAGNTYTAETRYLSGNVFGSFLAFAIAASPLSSGSITVADTSTGTNNFTNCVAQAWSVTGNATSSVEDTGVQAANSATSGTPSFTSGAASQANDLLFYSLNSAGGLSAYAEDAAWTNLVNQVLVPGPFGNTVLCAGYMVNTGTSAVPHSPTVAGSTAFATLVTGFKIAGAGPVITNTGATLPMMGV